MRMSIEERFRRAEEKNRETMDLFFFNIENFKKDTIKLNGTRFNVFEQLNNILLSGNVETFSELQEVFLKSNYLNDSIDKVLEYAPSYADRKPLSGKIFSEFMNDYLSKGEVYKPTKNVDEKRELLLKVIAENLEDTFGEIIHLGYYNAVSKKIFIIDDLKKTFQKRGYKIVGNYAVLDKSLDKKPEIEHQDFILEYYCKVLSDFLSKSKRSKENFEIVDKFLTNCDKLLTNKTKNLPKYKETSQILEKTRNEVAGYVDYEKTKFNDYYREVKKALQNVRASDCREEDKKVLDDFYKTILNVKEALNFKDSNGNRYIVNYFLNDVSHGVSPFNMNNLMIFAEKANIYNDAQYKEIAQVKELLRKNFLAKYSFPTNNQGDRILDKDDLKIIIQRRFNIKSEHLDLSDNQRIDKFTDKLMDYIKNNGLVQTYSCIRNIVPEFIHGRNPINLGFKREPITQK